MIVPPLMVKTKKNFKFEKILKFTQFCKFCSVFKDCSSGICGFGGLFFIKIFPIEKCVFGMYNIYNINDM